MYVRHGARIGADDTHAEACCRRMLRREGRRERGGVGVGGVFFLSHKSGMGLQVVFLSE
jgi:hypothetical protein